MQEEHFCFALFPPVWLNILLQEHRHAPFFQQRPQKGSRPPLGEQGLHTLWAGGYSHLSGLVSPEGLDAPAHPHLPGPGPTRVCLFMGSPGWCPEGGWSQNKAGAAPQA